MRTLPRAYHPFRVFLDSNALQALLDHGGAIFDGEPLGPPGRSGADTADVLALRGLMVFTERGSFEFALSPNSLREVEAADGRYLRWAYDVLDHWEACIGEAAEPFSGSGTRRAALLDGGGFGYLSAADALLVRDALLLECDTFLTIERRLVRSAGHLSRALALEVLRPPEVWELMRPHLRGL